MDTNTRGIGDQSGEPSIARTIVVLVDGGPTDEAVIELSCLLAARWNARLHLFRPVVVDRALALDATLPEASEQARAVLERAERTAARFGCTNIEVTEVRTRDVAVAVIDEAADLGSDLVVLGATGGENVARSLSVARYVLQEAPCPVWVYRGRHVGENVFGANASS